MTPGGDLLVSFDLTETVTGVSADDGAIVLIPSSAIIYASMSTILSASALGISLNVVWQAFDLGAVTFTTPSGMQSLKGSDAGAGTGRTCLHAP